MHNAHEVLRAALRSCRGVFLFVAVVSLFINALMLTGPIFMLQIYDRVLTSHSIPTLVSLAAIAVGLYGFFAVLEAVRMRILSRVGGRLDRELSGLAFECGVRLPLIFGSRSERREPARDLETIRQFLSGPCPSTLFDVPWLPVYLGIVYLFHPSLGLIATAGAGVICALIGINELLVRKPLHEAAEQAARRNAISQDARINAEAVTAMGMIPGLRSRWLKEGEAFGILQSRASDRAAAVGSIIKTFRFMLQSAILGYGAYLVIEGQVTPGVIIAASIITARALAPVEQSAAQWRGFVTARQALRRLKEVLRKMNSSVPEAELPAPCRTLHVENASVAAPGDRTPIIQNISFDLSAGEILGVIGPSSAGKSTLGRAIVGVWPLVQGAVRLDGADLGQWERTKLGQTIGYLPQDVQLFSGTVAENIARFQPGWKSENVVKAAGRANAHDLIARLPEGYDTHVGEGGAILSGGQRQRIALARAVYGDPFLVVLDEPNSNLDGEGEAALTEALYRMKDSGCVVVVIAHRPTAIAAAGKLLVLSEGRVRAYGPKNEVLKGATVESVKTGGGLKVVSEKA